MIYQTGSRNIVVNGGPGSGPQPDGQKETPDSKTWAQRWADYGNAMAGASGKPKEETYFSTERVAMSDKAAKLSKAASATQTKAAHLQAATAHRTAADSYNSARTDLSAKSIPGEFHSKKADFHLKMAAKKQ